MVIYMRFVPMVTDSGGVEALTTVWTAIVENLMRPLSGCAISILRKYRNLYGAATRPCRYKCASQSNWPQAG